MDRRVDEDRGVAVPAASTSLRVQVSVRSAISQLQPSPPALAIELNEWVGTDR